MQEEFKEVLNILEYMNNNCFNGEFCEVHKMRQIDIKEVIKYENYVIKKIQNGEDISIKEIQKIHLELLKKLYGIHDVISDYMKISLENK